ncbi:beta-propeller fold lactonase family protein [Halioxenophilus sp. WMMB6]|uniref:beta-propeller fold lactonase family protein n=1 Tax=Halioxenophilus sp. WMMB6 TaxID=3073815 RepID=UPI00295E3C30|nr:beta-propeller fold lactonase family protein [Halioxenophilus sp. WMMB6]
MSSLNLSTNKPLLPAAYVALAAALLIELAPIEVRAEDNTVPLVMEIFIADKYPIPQFQANLNWPQLPAGTLLGQVSGLAVDSDDTIWILQRPNSVSAEDLAAAAEARGGDRCQTAPHVLQFKQTGELLRGWGGEALAPILDGINQWPANVHGLFVDGDGVWLAGNGGDDHVVLNFSKTGKFRQQYGRRGASGGNSDPELLGNPADIFHDPASGQLAIADGYINRRVIQFDNRAHRFDQLWGAYGRPPAGVRAGQFDVSQAVSEERGNPESASFGDIMHCVNRASDGLLYVCDRRNNRVQIFKADSAGRMQFVANLAVSPDSRGPGSATDVAFSPDERYLYIADMANGKIWIYWRENLELLAAIGGNGRAPGEFTWLHSVATDSSGNLYTSEVSRGRRAQKLVLLGFSAPL